MAGFDRKNSNAALIAALAGGKSVAAAARLAGVSEKTARRRVADAEFRERVEEARRAMLSRAIGHMTQGTTEAAITLRKLLKADDKRVQLGAARALLELGPRLKETVEMEERLTRLERIADESA